MAGDNVFPPLKPTPEEHAAYQKVAQRLLDATVQHYQVHTFHHRREMSRKKWKPVKSREYLTVYKEREPAPRGADDVGEDWSDPKLLVATGAVIGSLDDVMYGVVTPDAASMLLKAAITKNGLVGGAVLSQLEGPTAREPFRFLGVKWFVLGAPPSLASIVRSRDLVFVEATGIRTLPNGERLGYQLMQSVSIPGYGALEGQPITRGRISSCSIFKQLANGTVDVYVRGHVEAFGKVMDAVALKFAASGFLSSWNAVGCARYKKLMWCVTHRRSRGSSADDGAAAAGAAHAHRSCAACNRRFGKFSSVGMCVLCKQWMCSRCRVVSKLRDVSSEDLSIEEKDAVVCTACVAHVDEQSAFEIAREEVRSGRFAPSRARPVIKLWSLRGRSDSRARDSASLVPEWTGGGHDAHGDDDAEHEREREREAAAYRARFQSEGVRLYDPTQLYGSAKSRAHSSDSESASTERASLAPADVFRYPHDPFDVDIDADVDDNDDVEDSTSDALAAPAAYSQSVYAVAPRVSDFGGYSQQQSHSPPQQLRAARAGSPEQLYKQMLDLQAATEQIYQLTLKTSDAHIQRVGGARTRLVP